MEIMEISYTENIALKFFYLVSHLIFFFFFEPATLLASKKIICFLSFSLFSSWMVLRIFIQYKEDG